MPIIYDIYIYYNSKKHEITQMKIRYEIPNFPYR